MFGRTLEAQGDQKVFTHFKLLSPNFIMVQIRQSYNCGNVISEIPYWLPVSAGIHSVQCRLHSPLIASKQLLPLLHSDSLTSAETQPFLVILHFLH